jgi:hypothetical protein
VTLADRLPAAGQAYRKPPLQRQKAPRLRERILKIPRIGRDRRKTERGVSLACRTGRRGWGLSICCAQRDQLLITEKASIHAEWSD